MSRDLSDVVGLESQKRILEETLFMPFRKSEQLRKIILRHDKVRRKDFYLFYGPSGTGKTYFGTSIAGELNVPFEYMSATELLQKYVGEGPKKLRETYKDIERRKGVLFIDEIDAIAVNRNLSSSSHTRDVLNQLLCILDGADYPRSSISIFATNMYDSLDKSFLDRIPKYKHIYFPEMDEEQRRKILLKQTEYYNNNLTNIDEISKKIETVSARDFEFIFELASNYAANNDSDCIENEHLEKSISNYFNLRGEKQNVA